ncbi:MAG: transcriptional regulator [Myxococcales bacterium]|nr:transcriptional regulator [Myxococcales bacterium]
MSGTDSAGHRPLVRKRYSQAQRLLHIYQSLANARGGLTITELIERTGVTRRTLNRDLALLSEDHFVRVLERDNEGHKRWALLPAGVASSITFSHSELFALYLSRSMLDFARGTELHKSMRAAFNKVADRLAGSELEAMALARKLYAVPDAPPVGVTSDAFDDVLNDVLTAVLRENQLELSYPDSRSGQILELQLDPLTLAYYRGRLYLIAYSAHHGRVRPFALHRATGAQRLRHTHAQVPDDYNPERHFSGQFGLFGGDDPVTVRVRFYGTAARYARERLWHASQQTTDFSGGDCEMKWSIPLTPDLSSWLLSFGAGACVLEPAELRASLRDELRAAADRYDD